MEAMSKSPSRRFPVTVTQLPVTRCQICHRTVAYRPGTVTEVLTDPIVRGWMQYYGAFYRSAMCQLLSRINAYLVRWIRKKYKRLRAEKKAIECWRGITERYPRLFAHWIWVPSVARVW